MHVSVVYGHHLQNFIQITVISLKRGKKLCAFRDDSLNLINTYIGSWLKLAF